MKTSSNSQRQPLGVKAYEEICRRIITLEYKPGQILDEKYLMATSGLGRTPIREALLRLAGEGWLESQPNKGTIVPAITLQGTKALFEAMKILEVGIAGLAIGQNNSSLLESMESENDQVRLAIKNGDLYALGEANHAFHSDFARCSKNEYLIRAVNEVRNQSKRLSYLSFSHEIPSEKSLHIHYQSVVEEHEKIILSLKKKDDLKLKETLLQHIDSFQNRIISYMIS
jgi:GntR family transcriptional regulator, rspAB operon transcriptional repressor